MEYPFPIRFRYQAMTIEENWTEARRRECPVIDLGDVLEWMKDERFDEWEDALLRCEWDHFQRLSILGMLGSASDLLRNTRRLADLTQSLGIRVNTKDRKGGTTRLYWRILRELSKPTVLERAVEKQRKLCLPPKLVGAIESLEWEKVQRIFQQEEIALRLERQTKSIPSEERRGKEAEMLSFFYILLMLYDDERVVELWLERMSQSLDPELALFEEIYREPTQGYLNVRFRMSNEDIEVQELHRLRQRVEELQAENDYLLSFLVQPSHPATPSEGCRETFANPLIGKRILVIGDEGHAPAYRAILERFGASMDFLPGFDKDRQLASKLSGADGMVFITAYASHLKFYALKAAKAKDTCVLVHQAGLGEFAKGVQALCDRLSTSG